MLEQKDNPERRILDVRKASEYDEGHLENALNQAHTRLLETSDELDQQYTYMVHCRSGSRASVAAALLKRKGFNVELVDDRIDRIESSLVRESPQKQSV